VACAASFPDVVVEHKFHCAQVVKHLILTDEQCQVVAVCENVNSLVQHVQNNVTKPNEKSANDNKTQLRAANPISHPDAPRKCFQSDESKITLHSKTAKSQSQEHKTQWSSLTLVHRICAKKSLKKGKN